MATLFVALGINTWGELQKINTHQFLNQCLDGLQSLVFSAVGKAYEKIGTMADKAILAVPVCLLLLYFLIYLQRLLLQPNRLLADEKGIKLVLRVGEAAIPLSRVAWAQIKEVNLHKNDAQDWKIRLTKIDGQHFDLDLAALEVEHRPLLLKRMEKFVPQCEINHELTQSLLPKAERSYTEIWLQSLNQAPERKSLQPLEPGLILSEGRYEVLRRLGVGGQGTAYLCRSLLSREGENVVLKETILPIFVKESVRRESLARFENEAQMLKLLSSDATVKLIDYFIEDHRAYMVLEHIDGSSLRELVERDGRLSEERVQDLSLQMSRILKLLHSHSIVHRDFTPDNLILSSKGVLKLIDFNVAQQMQGGSTGTIVGKHAYLPPEQFRGKATSQSDLYAMGATMFYLLTGRDPEPISQSSPRKALDCVSERMDEIVKRATALDANARYKTAEEVEADLLSIDHEGATISIKERSNLEVLRNG